MTTLIASDRSADRAGSSKALTISLWVAQGLLAAVFLMAGGMKLTAPPEQFAQAGIAPGLARFIGVAEIAGALGLVLPAATGILPFLTPLAALGLTVVMVLATGFHVQHGDTLAHTLMPVPIGAIAAFVAWGRFRRNATRA